MTHQLKILNDLAYIIENIANDYTGEAKSELNDLCKFVNDNSTSIEDSENLLLHLKEALKHLHGGAKIDASRVLGTISRTLWEKIGKNTKTATNWFIKSINEVRERLSIMNRNQLLALAIFILSTLGWIGIYDYQASGAYIFRINRLTHTVYVANAGDTMWVRITEESNIPAR